MNLDELTPFACTVYRGTTKSLRFLIRESDGTVTDITGWSLTFTARLREVDADPPAINQSISITPPATNGEVLVTLTRAQTLALKAGKNYTCSVFRTDSGAEELIGIGLLYVKNSIYDPQA